MNEEALIKNIVGMAEDEVKRKHAHAVDKIELEIGTQAGVEFDALDVAWNAGVKNTVLQNAEKKISKIQAMARCTCGCEYPVMEPYQPCPACLDVYVEYLQGRELKVKELTLS